jgi:hypothetical protein
MDRRGFLKMLGLAAPVAIAPTYFFAPIGGWKSDVIINPNQFTRSEMRRALIEFQQAIDVIWNSSSQMPIWVKNG